MYFRQDNATVYFNIKHSEGEEHPVDIRCEIVMDKDVNHYQSCRYIIQYKTWFTTLTILYCIFMSIFEFIHPHFENHQHSNFCGMQELLHMPLSFLIAGTYFEFKISYSTFISQTIKQNTIISFLFFQNLLDN